MFHVWYLCMCMFHVWYSGMCMCTYVSHFLFTGDPPWPIVVSYWGPYKLAIVMFSGILYSKGDHNILRFPP